MFVRGLSAAFEVPDESVSNLVVSETTSPTTSPTTDKTDGPGLRRLQTFVKRYQVSYEVVLPSSMQPDAMMLKATRITVEDTAEFQLLNQVLMEYRVVEIRQIVEKIPPRRFEDEVVTIAAPRTEVAQEASVTSPVLIVLSSLIVAVGVFSALFVAVRACRRRRAAAKESNGVLGEGESSVWEKNLHGVLGGGDHDLAIESGSIHLTEV